MTLDGFSKFTPVARSRGNGFVCLSAQVLHGGGMATTMHSRPDSSKTGLAESRLPMTDSRRKVQVSWPVVKPTIPRGCIVVFFFA